MFDCCELSWGGLSDKLITHTAHCTHTCWQHLLLLLLLLLLSSTSSSLTAVASIKVWGVSFCIVCSYTGCPRRNGQNFGRVFLMLNYTDVTQNTYIQRWTVTEIMAIEKCGLLGCPCIVRCPWRHTRTLRMPGNQTPLASIVMQWPWRDNTSASACVNYLET